MEVISMKKREKTKKSKSDWFIIKENQRWSISVFVNLQSGIYDGETSVNRTTMDVLSIYLSIYLESVHIYLSIYLEEVPVVQWLSSQDMDTATRVQILDLTDCISHSTNTIGKGMNPKYSPSSYG